MPLIENKKVRLNYEIVETLEAGMELSGGEVKSLRGRHGSLEGSHVTVRAGEAFLLGARIPPYQAANSPRDYDPERSRRLLLSKKELAALAGHEQQKGLTIVPLSVYTRKNRIKIEIALVRGKKKYDKREALKKRESEREIDRTLKYT